MTLHEKLRSRAAQADPRVVSKGADGLTIPAGAASSQHFLAFARRAGGVNPLRFGAARIRGLTPPARRESALGLFRPVRDSCTLEERPRGPFVSSLGKRHVPGSEPVPPRPRARRWRGRP